MLNRVDNQDLQNKQLNQAAGMDKTGLLGSKNPYSKIDKNLLVDQLDISVDALKLYERDLDIAKFRDLTLSDPDDKSHNFIVAQQMLNGEIQVDNEDIFDTLFSNDRLINDLLS